MGKRAAGLSAAKVKTAAPGRYGDGDGLYLYVRRPDSAFWVFRFTRAGKMREMGLGRARGANSVTLAEAREKAGALFRTVRAGYDPLAEREALEAAALAEAQMKAILGITFREATNTYLAARESAWANSKHRAQWATSMDMYVHPYFGDVPVMEVTTAHVLAALEPIWGTKRETAARVRGRIEAVLSAATVKGMRTGDNPARWRGHLSEILPGRARDDQVEHHPALPYGEIGVFMAALRAQRGTPARAMEFTILTAARTGEVTGARWSEIDLNANSWIIPASRMKAGKEHRVPLSSSALDVLRQMAMLRDMTEIQRGSNPLAYIFPGYLPNKPLSSAAMAMALRRMKWGKVTVHGFRSCFRDWTAEQTGIAREVAEAALAHTFAGRTEAAYQRSDFFDKRKKLMEAWGRYCSKLRPVGGAVVQLHQAGRDASNP